MHISNGLDRHASFIYAKKCIIRTRSFEFKPRQQHRFISAGYNFSPSSAALHLCLHVTLGLYLAPPLRRAGLVENLWFHSSSSFCFSVLSSHSFLTPCCWRCSRSRVCYFSFSPFSFLLLLLLQLFGTAGTKNICSFWRSTRTLGPLLVVLVHVASSFFKVTLICSGEKKGRRGAIAAAAADASDATSACYICYMYVGPKAFFLRL